jgi:hypothetical protein
MFFDHHLGLTLPEEREEDDEKVMLTRYTPLGVVGAVSTLLTRLSTRIDTDVWPI